MYRGVVGVEKTALRLDPQDVREVQVDYPAVADDRHACRRILFDDLLERTNDTILKLLLSLVGRIPDAVN